MPQKTRYDVDGVRMDATPQQTQFTDKNIVCVVEPDKSMTVRQIYDAWTHGRPTSVHPFECTFDDKADDIDFDDENPIDLSQVENNMLDAQMKIEDEKSLHRKKKSEQHKEDSFIKKLADAITPKTSE